MNRRKQPLWTIDELTRRVGLALQAADYSGVDNGRVSDVPALRTIRYYTTLGLLDRPAEMSGRTALYSTRHLLQLAAIKRLQARGLPLADVQEQLSGLPDAALRKLAHIAQDVVDMPAAAVDGPVEPPRREQDFWRTPAAAPQDSFPATGVSVFQNVPLHEQLVVMVRTAAPLSPDDVEAVQHAAQALLQTLQQRGLIKP
jgi:DNA-binding transcriptional MerR regulator